MNSFTVSVYAAHHHFAIFVNVYFGFHIRTRASVNGFFIGLAGIFHPKCNYFDAIAM